MPNANKEMFNYLSSHISKSDIYASKAIAKISMFIFKYRQDLNMTQKDFARMLGVSQGMVSKWESSEYNFTIQNIAQISEKLKVVFDIDFTPESEYLKGHIQNVYTNNKKKARRELARIESYIDSAA